MSKLTLISWLTAAALLVQPAARAASGCDADMRPGLNHITVISGDQKQQLDLLMPGSFKPSKRVPLVIGLHPSSGSGATFDQDTGLSAAANAKGFAVTFPDGGITQSGADGSSGHYWNIPGVPLIGGNAVPSGTRDDVRFIADAIDHVVAHSCVDAHRIYVTGFSGGARMSSMVGCRLADRVAAIAPVAGLRAGRATGPGFTEPDAGDCNPSRPVSVFAIHGTDDPTNPFPGGEGLRWGYSVERALARWASLDHCDAAPAVEALSAHITRVLYGACDTGKDVELYRIDARRDQGGGHVWPDGKRDLSTRAPAPSGGSGNAPTDQRRVELDATQNILQFFARH